MSTVVEVLCHIGAAGMCICGTYTRISSRELTLLVSQCASHDLSSSTYMLILPMIRTRTHTRLVTPANKPIIKRSESLPKKCLVKCWLQVFGKMLRVCYNFSVDDRKEAQKQQISVWIKEIQANYDQKYKRTTRIHEFEAVYGETPKSLALASRAP